MFHIPAHQVNQQFCQLFVSTLCQMLAINQGYFHSRRVQIQASMLFRNVPVQRRNIAGLLNGGLVQQTSAGYRSPSVRGSYP